LHKENRIKNNTRVSVMLINSEWEIRQLWQINI
jgi:selenocysteine lyase/cysteine desulfurase